MPIPLALAVQGGCPIVIMAERDKTEMESEVSKHEFDLQGSRIICRSGWAFACPPSCTVLHDLHLSIGQSLTDAQCH